jgi:hypothetical protein
LLECIPKVYDTERTLKILGEDGVESEILINPDAAQEYQREDLADKEKIRIIFNPSFAKYSVESDVGPDYATKRQEAFNAFTQIIGQNPDLIKVCGDIMMRAADFPMADELADRLKRLVPPAVLGKGPTPEVQQLMQQNQTAIQNIQALILENSKLRASKDVEYVQKDIDAFRAETDRLKVLMDGIDPNQIASMTAQLVLQVLNTKLPVDELNSVIQQQTSSMI